jgi:hypothetical protein
MNQFQINNIYINKYYFSKYQINKIKKKFGVKSEFDNLFSPLVFNDSSYFIGNDFEMYEIIKYL